MSGERFLSRWSRRKRAAATGVPDVEAAPAAARPAPPAATAGASEPASAVASASPAEPAPAAGTPPASLPPVESLSMESDFAPFMAKDVDPALKRAALRKLFEDERFNVMDGLDVYIDDYTKPAPVPPEWYERMAQMALLGDAAPQPAAAAAGEEGRDGEKRARHEPDDDSHDDLPSAAPGTLPPDGAPG